MSGGWNADLEGARLHVAIVAPPFVRVPPEAYGGTELVVGDLARCLAAQGHRVTLYATGDSAVPGCETRWLFRRPLWPPEPMGEWNHCVYAANALADSDVDVVHSNVPALLPLVSALDIPVVHTVHHADEERHLRYYRERARVQFVCISRRQAEMLSGHFPSAPKVIHHGLEVDRYPPGAGEAGDALFIGRLDAVKAPHLALAAARAAGFSLRIAGKAHEGDYFETVLAPTLLQDGVKLVGEVGGEAKLRALGSAKVLVFSSVWEEPFGLASIEAMLCGTPVAGLARGALPEIVEEGVTGYLADEPRDLAGAIRLAAKLDRTRVRERARARFGAERMTGEYLRVFRAAMQARERVPALHV